MDRGGIRGLSRVGYAAFLLIGATTVLVPALVVYVERTFAVADADLGIFYFVTAVSYAAGSLFGGMLTERLGRRLVLTVAALLTAAGLGGEAVAPSWAVFLVFAVPEGLGAGGIDGGVNGLFMAIFTGARGGALNMLHLFFALGALIAPIVVGTLVSGGLAWQVPLGAGALIAVGIGGLLATRPMPSGRHGRHPGHAAQTLDGDRLSRWPFVLLAAAICLYVASETGVSSWVVRFLESSPVTVATGTLSAFWGGLALGRLLATRIADRLDPVAFAATSMALASVAMVAAVASPVLPLTVVLFGVAGLCCGPVYPMIMAIAGSLYPRRLAAVSGSLAAAAVAGSVFYPPIVGFISAGYGIGVGLAGAGLLGVGCTMAIVLAGMAARTSTRTSPATAP